MQSVVSAHLEFTWSPTARLEAGSDCCKVANVCTAAAAANAAPILNTAEMAPSDPRAKCCAMECV